MHVHFSNLINYITFNCGTILLIDHCREKWDKEKCLITSNFDYEYKIAFLLFVTTPASASVYHPVVLDLIKSLYEKHFKKVEVLS